MAIRFVVDSASDLTMEEVRALGVTHVPMTVCFGEEEYLDCVTMNHHDFYMKLVEMDVMPVTSQVPPARFEDAIRPLAEAGDDVIVITVSAALSGTYQSAVIAAQKWPGQVRVIDSRSVTIGQRILLQRGLQLAADGQLTADEIVSRLQEEKQHIRVIAVLDTLEYLRRGGRVSATLAIAGTMLGIKPVVAVEDGKVALCGKARGSRNASNALRRLIADSRGIDFDRPVSVAYSGFTDAMLRKYIEDSADLWQHGIDELPVSTIGCVIGTHVGPGAYGCAFFEKE